MTVAVAEFSFLTHGTSRDETLLAADNLAIGVLDQIGGGPWVMIDDDIDRNHAPGNMISDDHGYLYIAKRRYVFGGPVKELVDPKPGYITQKLGDNE